MFTDSVKKYCPSLYLLLVGFHLHLPADQVRKFFDLSSALDRPLPCTS